MCRCTYCDRTVGIIFADVGYAHDFDAAAHLGVGGLAGSMHHEAVARDRSIFADDLGKFLVRLGGRTVVARVENDDGKLIRRNDAVSVFIVFGKIDVRIAGFDDVMNGFGRCGFVGIAFKIAQRGGMRQGHRDFKDSLRRAFFLRMVDMYGIEPKLPKRHLLIKIHKRIAALSEEAIIAVLRLGDRPLLAENRRGFVI